MQRYNSFSKHGNIFSITLYINYLRHPTHPQVRDRGGRMLTILFIQLIALLCIATSAVKVTKTHITIHINHGKIVAP